MAIAKKTAVKVSDSGELVTLEIAHLKFTLEFDLALRLSSMLLVEGRIARRIQGGVNLFPKLRTAGVLVDLNAAKKRRSRWERLAQRLQSDNVRVKNSGVQVTIFFGKNGMDLPWNVALQLAQWLRIHGKLARNAAGETKSWNKIATQ